MMKDTDARAADESNKQDSCASAQNTARSEGSVSKWLGAKVSLSHPIKVSEAANRKFYRRSIVTSPLSRTVSEIKNFYLPRPSSPQIWRSYLSNFRTVLGSPSRRNDYSTNPWNYFPTISILNVCDCNLPKYVDGQTTYDSDSALCLASRGKS